MNKRPTRLVAVLLAMLMCLTLLPVTAMAEIAELPAKVLTALQSSEGLKTLFTPAETADKPTAQADNEAANEVDTSIAPITVSDGTTNYAVSLTNLPGNDFCDTIYKAVLPADFKSVTVTWTVDGAAGGSGACWCEANGTGNGSLTVPNHECEAPSIDLSSAVEADASVIFLTLDDSYGLILQVGGKGEKPDTPKQKHALSATASLIFSHKPDSVGNRKGTITFKDKNNNVIEEALSGESVTVTAEPKRSETFEFVFDHWTTSDISLTEDEKKSSTLTFTMPDSDVNLHADFKNKGTLVLWCAQPDTVADVHFSIKNQYGPDTFKTGTNQVATIITSDWIDQYEFLGWQVTCDGEDVSDNPAYVSFIDPLPAEPTYGKFKSLRLTIMGSEMQIVAKFKERHFASVTTTVNDNAMGTATAVVGTGTPTATLPVVFEGQTVTLTATPGDRYSLKGWEVKEDGSDTLIPTTPVEDNANQATFTMPATNKPITAKAIFKFDPEKASNERNVTGVNLYSGSTDGAPINQGFAKEGTKLTITLPANMDTANLADLILKFTVSDYATIKQKDANENWPADGKACGMALDTPVTFTVTAENGKTQDYTLTITKAKSSEKKITAVKLLNSGKSVIAEGVQSVSGTMWTITLPSDTDKALINKIGTSTDVFMQIDYTGVSLAQAEGYSDASAVESMKWSSGNVMCGISPNSSKTFTVTAEDDSTKEYTVEIKYTAPNAPTLSGGSATRTSKTAATVKFTSSEAGNYFYKVVDHGAAVPTVDTSKSGTSAVKGENTITLSNLTEDARDIYIVVKNASGGESAALKVEIPAYGSSETPDTGKFTITVNAPTKGGTLTTNRTKADKGDEIIVTVKPDSGYQMVEGSLTYSLAVAGGETVKITGNRFTMPLGNVTITCKWETASVASSGITGFSINGVAGTVNSTTNTITITMPRGTDVTKLTPAISTNGVKSLAPGSGETVNFTNSVTYTATMDDGSTKTYIVTVYVDKGTLADQFWDKLTDFYQQVPWWKYAEQQQSSSKYPKYW